MTTRDPSRFVLVPRALARRWGILLFSCAAALAAGCSDSGGSADNDPFAEYEGVWAVDKDQDTSSLSCPGDPDPTLANVKFSLWGSEVIISRGVLTDIVEVQGACQFNYDVDASMHVATLASPDPYTGKPPSCTVGVGQNAGEEAVITPLTSNDSPWLFKLLKPVAGAAPTAQIVGTANVVLTLSDQLTGQLQTSTCVFAAEVESMHKIAKP
jgi:hypothetical protein